VPCRNPWGAHATPALAEASVGTNCVWRGHKTDRGMRPRRRSNSASTYHNAVAQPHPRGQQARRHRRRVQRADLPAVVQPREVVRVRVRQEENGLEVAATVLPEAIHDKRRLCEPALHRPVFECGALVTSSRAGATLNCGAWPLTAKVFSWSGAASLRCTCTRWSCFPFSSII
jgi:hypothetical protein